MCVYISTPFATSRPEARRGELRVWDTKRRVVDNGVWAMGMLEQRWMQAGVVWCDGMGGARGEALLFTGEI